MERCIRVFPTHALAAEANRQELAALTPQERLDRALDLHARYRESFDETRQGLARIARVVPFKER